MALQDIPKVSLGHFPTPLEDAPRLAERIGLKKLLFKRDDQTGLALGGNKVRKLEFIMAEVLRQGCDIVLTVGGPQSNHARLTAAAARIFGLDSLLILGGPKFDRFEGNLLLDILLNAEIRYMPDANTAEMLQAMDQAADELRRSGRNPYVVPFGGSTPQGAIGYANAIKELAEQLGSDTDPQIVLAVGSGGTLAGVRLGTELFLPEARVIGIEVGRNYETFPVTCSAVANEAAELASLEVRFKPDQFETYSDYLGDRYGVPSEAGNAAIILTAQTEATILDPVYTGKAMSGLIDMAKSGAIDPDRTVIFLHTGGSPALCGHEESFRHLAKYTEI